MLEGLSARARRAGLADRIIVGQNKGDHLPVEDYAGRVDFAPAFALVHEVAKPDAMFADIHNALKLGGRLLVAEPAGHVKPAEFKVTLSLPEQSGFVLTSQPAIRRSLAAVLIRSLQNRGEGTIQSNASDFQSA